MARTKPINRPRWRQAALAVAALIPGSVFAQSSTRVEEDVVVLGRWDNPFGYSAIGLPRRRRRRRARCAAAATDRRDPRGRAGPHRHAAQRHRQVEPDVPARLQPRSRHGFRDLGRRHAREPADARARPGLHGPEFPDSRARRAARVPQRRVLRGGVGLLVRRRRVPVDLRAACPKASSKAASARTATSARSRPTASRAGSGELLYGVQVHRYDGPWVDINEDVERNNLLLRYSTRTDDGGWNVALMGYDAQWNSADQIPRRAVESGLISPLGSIDTTLGGETSRYSLSGSWAASTGRGPRTRERVRDRLRARPVLELHLPPRRPDRRRPIRAAATSARSRAAISRTRSAGSAPRRTRSARCCATTTSAASGCSARRSATRGDRAQRQRRRAQRSASTTPTRRAGPTSCARRSACAPITSTSTWRATCRRTPATPTTRCSRRRQA